MDNIISLRGSVFNLLAVGADVELLLLVAMLEEMTAGGDNGWKQSQQ